MHVVLWLEWLIEQKYGVAGAAAFGVLIHYWEKLPDQEKYALCVGGVVILLVALAL